MSDVIPASLESVRRVVAECQAYRIKWPGVKGRGVLLDLFTASAIIRVVDAVNDDNRAKLTRMIAESPVKFQRVARFCLAA